jgi:hypothetical protein
MTRNWKISPFMLKKDGTIRGEAMMDTLTPKLIKIFNAIPKTGTAEIKITMKNHQVIGTVYRYTEYTEPRQASGENTEEKQT